MTDPADFKKLDLRCHALLSDVPLHDIWSIPLDNGGPGRTIEDLGALFLSDRWSPPNVGVRALFALRWWLGRVFRWDDERHDPPAESYLNRLTEADHQRSRLPPGSRIGRFRVLYVFRDEAVSEIRNATVHGFVALALTRREQGYVAYAAIYVQPVSHLTAFYMALIDPFRRFVVYPSLRLRIQQAWLRAYTDNPRT
jgi:uncharacterized protein DUF2867